MEWNGMEWNVCVCVYVCMHACMYVCNVLSIPRTTLRTAFRGHKNLGQTAGLVFGQVWNKPKPLGNQTTRKPLREVFSREGDLQHKSRQSARTTLRTTFRTTPRTTCRTVVCPAVCPALCPALFPALCPALCPAYREGCLCRRGFVKLSQTIYIYI